jgi:hypothetical protein
MMTFSIEYVDPYDNTRTNQPDKATAFSKFLASGKYPVEQRIEDKKRGIGRQKQPFVGQFTEPYTLLALS